MHAYSEDYLFDAMETLGEAFDCAVSRGGLSPQQFFDLFVSTNIADAFGAGAPRYVAGTSGAELVLDVAYQAGIDVGILLGDNLCDEASPEYWCGWVLAFWQWRTGRPFRNIRNHVSIDEVLALYNPLHEAAEEKFVEVIEQRIHCTNAPLKQIREARGLSQPMLAEKSGVALRSIQQFEQRYKDINHCQVQTLYRLAQTLGCRIEDLLEYPLD